MRKNKIILRSSNNLTGELLSIRRAARIRNLKSSFGEYIINKLISPDTKEHYSYSPEIQSLICKTGAQIPINNGIPDFMGFSTDALVEKAEQANFHDNEDKNENFIEIVLRPYNYNLFHAKIWLEHLIYSIKIIEKHIKTPLDGMMILNCGCGGGFEAQFFAEQGVKMVGFDISQLRTEAAATRFALNNLDGFFFRGDAAILPFEDNSFDMVIYHDSLHHVPIEEIPKTLKEACRVAKTAIILIEANDSPFRMFLESIGLSTSIEPSGNYVFRFKKSLMLFWSKKFDVNLVVYKTRFIKREHRPKFFAIPLIGYLGYYCIRIFGFVLSTIGNEAVIILGKEKNNND